MGIVLAVLASLGIGSGNVLLKKSFKDFSPSISFFIFSIFSLIFWGTIGLITGVHFNHTIDGFLVGLSSAVLGQLAYIYFLSKVS